MLNVILIGAGNVAVHLARQFSQHQHITIIQRFRRNGRNDRFFDPKIPVTSSLSHLKDADLYIISVSDQAISEVSGQIKNSAGLVVHTSGSVAMEALKCKNHKGVLYPLQSFTKEKTVDFSKIPVCIETEFPTDLDLLKRTATSLTDQVYEISSRQREKLHIAAVFANNFSNYMFKLANDLCLKNDIPFDILKPLILETAEKVQKISPEEAQTGPARRQDLKVIEKHLKQLKDNQQEIYNLVSQSILKTYK